MFLKFIRSLFYFSLMSCPVTEDIAISRISIRKTKTKDTRGIAEISDFSQLGND